jgi:hypothetical protein
MGIQALARIVKEPSKETEMSTPDTGPTSPKSDYDAYLGSRSPLARMGVPDTDRHVDTGQHSASRPVVATKAVDGTDAVSGPNGPGKENTRGLAAETAERYKTRG